MPALLRAARPANAACCSDAFTSCSRLAKLVVTSKKFRWFPKTAVPPQALETIGPPARDRAEIP
jgi:hypothetical protein